MSPQLTRATLQSLMDTCRGLDPIEPDLPVLVPGDRSLSTVLFIRLFIYLFLFFTSHYILESLNNRGRGREAAVDKRGGVIYKKEQIQNMLELAAELGVQPPTILDREKSGL